MSDKKKPSRPKFDAKDVAALAWLNPDTGEAVHPKAKADKKTKS